MKMRKPIDKQHKIQLFQKQKVRTHWDENQEKWFFSIIDVVAILTEQNDFQTARKYWNKLTDRLKKEGNETVTNCHQLKMLTQNGNKRTYLNNNWGEICIPVEMIAVDDGKFYALRSNLNWFSSFNENSTQCVEFLAWLTMEFCYE